MDWKGFFSINKTHLLLRIFFALLLFLFTLIINRFVLPIPYNFTFYLGQSIMILLIIYLPIELIIFLVRLYMFLEVKWYYSVIYMILFIISAFSGVYGSGKNDRIFFVLLFFFVIFFLGALLSLIKKK